MWDINETRGIWYEGAVLSVSAERLWDHTQLRQINPFPPITPHRPLNPESYIDVADRSGNYPELTGLTLLDLLNGHHGDLNENDVALLLRNITGRSTRQWISSVQHHLQQFSMQRAVRNLPTPFLPIDKTSPLCVSGLHCTLVSWLEEHRNEKASKSQWINRISNLTKKGLRSDELCIARFDTINETSGKLFTGNALLKCLNYSHLRISIVPVIDPTAFQLNFSQVTSTTPIKRLKPKLKNGLLTKPKWRDPMLGYWIDEIPWNDMFPCEPKWIAFTHRGEPIVTHDRPTGLCENPEIAKRLAASHAQKLLPKFTTKGKWFEYSLTGGENYREWLVTLPYYLPTFQSNHFSHRNILLHVRCDIRDGVEDERVLFLQEVQSDWAQNARRAMQEEDPEIPTPPWLHEWPELALKLMLQHAATLGVDALAWTTSSSQVIRYDGDGAGGLRKLYDQTLPKVANRLLRKHGVRCETIEVYVPTNFTIRPVDNGYEVLDDDGTFLGIATNKQEIRSLIPDGGHELLHSMHGIRLNEKLRRTILNDGFYAWGWGIT